MTTADDHAARLPRAAPEPLASYLAGLGLIRVLGEQADPARDRRLDAGRTGHHDDGAGHRGVAGR